MTTVALAVLASTAWTPVGSGKKFPKVIPLLSLDGSIAFHLDREAAGNLVVLPRNRRRC
jgi:hypothetical protein